MHARHVFWLDADPGALVMLLIGVSAVSFLRNLLAAAVRLPPAQSTVFR